MLYLGIQRTIVQKKNSRRFGLFFSPSFFTSSILKLLKSYSPRTSMITAEVRNIKIFEMEMEQFFPSYFGNGLLSTLRRPVILLSGMNYVLNSVPTRLRTEISGLKKQKRSPNQGMMMFGRLIRIWISQKISPAMYASVDMIICIIVISLMAIPAIAGNGPIQTLFL